MIWRKRERENEYKNKIGMNIVSPSIDLDYKSKKTYMIENEKMA